MQELRDYQSEAVEKIRIAIREGYTRILLVAPTGSGKTTVACTGIIQPAVERGNPVTFIAHRKELIDQCSERLDEHGIDHGIIKAGNKRYAPSLPVQVASVQTLVRRKKISLKPKIFFIDEAHRAMAKSYLTVIDMYPDAVIIGLTATPFRLDGRGLGYLFQIIIECSSPAELTEMGYLVPARVFCAPVLPSFMKMKKRGGDFAQEDIASAVNTNSIIGDICGHWIKHAKDRLTVCFAVTRMHAQRIMESFVSRGIAADYIDGEMDEHTRETKLRDFKEGTTRIMCNVGILTEGWDVPEVACVILARPTQSVALYLQMAGRALRPHPASGKVDCIILDHGGNTLVHGFVTDDREFNLDGLVFSEKDTTADKVIRMCEECFAAYSGTLCPVCGHQNKKNKNSDVKEIAGELVEMDPKEKLIEEKRYFFEHLRKQFHYGYKETFAAVNFKEKYGRWPGKQLGVKPRWQYDLATKKTKIMGFDYSKAIKEAGIVIKRREESPERRIAKFG